MKDGGQSPVINLKALNSCEQGTFQNGGNSYPDRSPEERRLAGKK